MNDTTVALEDMPSNTPSFGAKLITNVFMLISLLAAVLLLDWAVRDKLAHTEPMETAQITADMRERQLGCLAKNIYHEAGSEPFEGKIAVAQVTMNRVASSQFPGDVCKVIYQKNVFYERVVCQFSWVCDRETVFRPTNRANYEESMIAAKKVLLEDYRLPSLKNALYYHADYINPGWKKEKVAKIGHHIFYK
jgi:spore germination cell wall hydrolase CwlJ-like protein